MLCTHHHDFKFILCGLLDPHVMIKLCLAFVIYEYMKLLGLNGAYLEIFMLVEYLVDVYLPKQPHKDNFDEKLSQ